MTRNKFVISIIILAIVCFAAGYFQQSIANTENTTLTMRHILETPLSLEETELSE